MTYFFLALAETLALAQGEQLDADTISAHWQEAIRKLNDSEIGRPMAHALETALDEVERDGNGKSSARELIALTQR